MYTTIVNEWTGDSTAGKWGVRIQKPLEVAGVKVGQEIATTVTQRNGKATLCKVVIDEVRGKSALGHCVEKVTELRTKRMDCPRCAARNYGTRVTCYRCNAQLCGGDFTGTRRK